MMMKSVGVVRLMVVGEASWLHTDQFILLSYHMILFFFFLYSVFSVLKQVRVG